MDITESEKITATEIVQVWVSTEVKVGAKSVDVSTKSTVGQTVNLDGFNYGTLFGLKLAADAVAVFAGFSAKKLFDELAAGNPSSLDAEVVDQMVEQMNAMARDHLSHIIADVSNENDGLSIVVERPVDLDDM